MIREQDTHTLAIMATMLIIDAPKAFKPPEKIIEDALNDAEKILERAKKRPHIP